MAFSIELQPQQASLLRTNCYGSSMWGSKSGRYIEASNPGDVQNPTGKEGRMLNRYHTTA